MASFNIKVISSLCEDLAWGVVGEWNPFCLISQIIHFEVVSVFSGLPKIRPNAMLTLQKAKKFDHGELITET
jgi:hypothetical protein